MPLQKNVCCSNFKRLFSVGLQQSAEKINFKLTNESIKQMSMHAELLIHWNQKINLTAITDPVTMAEKHFIDAIAILPFLRNEIQFMDMGSGGGFPSIPLKILNPALSFTLVDASRKKVNFLKHVIRLLGLDRMEVIHSRVEDLNRYDQPKFDAIIGRAFAKLEKFVELASFLLIPGGVIYAMKGKKGLMEITPEIESSYFIRTEHYYIAFGDEIVDRYLICLKPKI